MEKQPVKKPKLKLVGTSGNAFALLALAKREARKIGMDPAEITAMMDEAMSGDYDNLLNAIGKRFDIR